MEEKKSFKEFLCSTSGGIVLTAVMYVVVFGLMALIGSMDLQENTVTGVIGLVLFGAWAVFGWKGLSKIQPRIFLIMPVAGWIAYFVIKGILSIILGIFIAPYQIAKMIRMALMKNA